MILSLFVGLILECIALVVPFPNLISTRETTDDMADAIMQKAVAPQTQKKGAPLFAFIDIDEDTWLDWGAPLVTPRDKVADLIEHAANSKPSAIIVDIDLAFPGGANEDALNQKLTEYAGREKAPPLVLVRSLVPTSRAISVAPRNTPAIKIPDNSNIYWALPSFERDEDGTVRRWQLATVACENGSPRIIPSAQLQMAWLDMRKTNDELHGALAALRPANCDKPVPEALVTLAAAQKLTVDGKAADDPENRNIEINTTDLSTRIMYTIPWQEGQIALGPKVSTNDQGVPEVDTYKVLVRSAKTVSQLQPGDEIPGLENRMAVIGGSFRESGDWYRTPLGEMPGVLILINSIDALIQHGTLKPPSWLEQMGLGMVFIAVVSFLIAWFRAPISTALSLGAVWAVTFATVPLFRSGYLFSAAVPALAIILADLILSLLEDVESMRKIGWRWILKPTPPPDIPQGDEKK